MPPVGGDTPRHEMFLNSWYMTFHSVIALHGVFKVVPGPHISHVKSKTVNTFLSSEFSTCSTLFAILKVKNKIFTKTEMPELIIY